MQKVTIVQRILPHYRVPLFERLAQRLRENDQQLHVVHGQELPGTVPRTVDARHDWALRVDNRYLLGGALIGQPWLPVMSESALIIAEHANSLALNHQLLWGRRSRRRARFAFWGHGRNARSYSASADSYKRWMARRADWWFVYTDSCVGALTAIGFARDSITVVNNSTDTSAIAEARARVPVCEQQRLRAALGVKSERVGIFCGGMYAEKRLAFLLDACQQVRTAVPDFELIGVGDGPDQYIMENAAARHPWIHYVGAKFGADLAPYLSIAAVALMPGLVGLTVIDSFAAGVPLVTTRLRIHSPEFGYLRSGVNGLISENSRHAYAQAVAAALLDAPLLERMRAGCRESARQYSLDAMVERYAKGIAACMSREARGVRARRVGVTGSLQAAPAPPYAQSCRSVSPVRVAVVTNILTPYRIPLFQAVYERVAGLRVFLMAEREENRDWLLQTATFPHEVLRGVHISLPGSEVSRHLNIGMQRVLRQYAPDVVLSGGFAPANFAAWWHCRRHRIPFVGWGELSVQDDQRHSKTARMLRRLLCGGSQGAVASSSEAADVFASYGVPRPAILTAVMPIDVDFYHTRARQFRDSGRAASERARYGSPLLVGIGRFAPRKGFRELFAIYAELLKEMPAASLLILGDGPERAGCEEYVQSHGWQNVHFLGFRQREEVAEMLALADAFVFPTLHDPFGAVLSEAMACEVPVASSIFAAATRDLVEEGVTGFRIDPRDPIASAHAVVRVLRMSVGDRALMTRRAYERVAQHDIASAADELVGFLGRVWRAGRAGGVLQPV